MEHLILTDADVARVLTMDVVVQKMADALVERANHTLVSPPRTRVQAGVGSLVFTAGAALGLDPMTGFRVYDTYPGDDPGKTQLVTVYDGATGALRGMVLGERLGALRTAGIGGVAIQQMAPQQCDVLAILGTGYQAQYQLEAALAVRDFQEIRVHSRGEENRARFVRWAQKRWEAPVIDSPSAEACVKDADVLICATSSHTPVFRKEWLKLGVHVNTLGPKTKDAHEMDMVFADSCDVIATDSLEQVSAYPKPFFLLDTPHHARMKELADLVVGKQGGQRGPLTNTLFCSVGLSGTEVVLANEALRRAREQGIGIVIPMSQLG